MVGANGGRADFCQEPDVFSRYLVESPARAEPIILKILSDRAMSVLCVFSLKKEIEWH